MSKLENQDIAKTFDPKSYLTLKKILYHFVLGLICFYMGGNLMTVLIFHLIWEIYQNSQFGKTMNFRMFGKHLEDCCIYESIADNILFILGWCGGWLIDNYNILEIL